MTMPNKNIIPNGSTPIKNDILIEVIAKGKLDLTEIRIIAYIIRFSWGFADKNGRQNWTKPIKIFEMAKNIGISRQLCSRVINKMVKENKLFIKDKYQYQFNEHYDTWEELSTKSDAKCQLKVTPMSTKSNALPQENSMPISDTRIPKETSKENIKRKDCTDICTVYKDICTTTVNCISSSNLDHKILKQTDKKQISSSFLTPPSPPNPPSLPSPSLTMYENEVLTYYMSLFNIAKVENQDIYSIKNLFLVEKSWHPKKVVNVVKKRLKQVKDKNQNITLKELEKWMWGRTKGEKEAQNKKRMKEFNEMMDKLEKQWRV